MKHFLSTVASWMMDEEAREKEAYSGENDIVKSAALEG
jgi:hypothetical protein